MFCLKHIYVLLFSITISNGLEASTTNSTFYADSIRFSFRLRALDLSEDASPLSSKNDELFLLVFTSNKKKEGSIIFECSFQMDSSKLDYIFYCELAERKSSLSFILIEMDTDRSLEQMKDLVKVNFKEIRKAYLVKNSIETQNIFGDDDLLGFKNLRIDKRKKRKIKPISFKGMQLFDRFHYTISLE